MVRTAEAMGVTARTVEHLKRRFVEEGLQAALQRKRRQRPPREVIFDGAFEARLIALACSPAPEGRRRWTVRLLAEAALARKVGSRIDATYRRSDLFERRGRLMDEAGYLAGPSREPQAGAALDGLPARDHCGGSDPEKGRGCGGFWRAPPPPPRWCTSAKKPGVALTTSTPPVRRAVTPGEGGTREAKPRIAVSQRRRKIRVVSRPVRRFRKVPHHTGEGSAL